MEHTRHGRYRWRSQRRCHHRPTSNSCCVHRATQQTWPGTSLAGRSAHQSSSGHPSEIWSERHTASTMALHWIEQCSTSCQPCSFNVTTSQQWHMTLTCKVCHWLHFIINPVILSPKYFMTIKLRRTSQTINQKEQQMVYQLTCHHYCQEESILNTTLVIGSMKLAEVRKVKK